MKLSQRLLALAQFVPQGYTVADIGSDHGYLPIYLVENNICPSAIAADINKMPIESARKNIKDMALEDKIDTRLGNGLAVLEPNEVDCITIAGMGGSLMCEILNNSPQIIHSLKRMILQPNIGAWNVRTWCEENGWGIIAEDLVFEEGHYYEIIAMEKGQTQYSYAEKMLGPWILKNKHSLLRNYMDFQKEKDNYLLKCMEKSTNEESKEKRQRILEKWRILEEEYRCRF